MFLCFYSQFNVFNINGERVGKEGMEGRGPPKGWLTPHDRFCAPSDPFPHYQCLHLDMVSDRVARTRTYLIASENLRAVNHCNETTVLGYITRLYETYY